VLSVAVCRGCQESLLLAGKFRAWEVTRKSAFFAYSTVGGIFNLFLACTANKISSNGHWHQEISASPVVYIGLEEALSQRR
jgi:hypothetical protein